MPGSAPAALLWLAQEWEAAIPSATFSGIVSSQVPAYGYHHGRVYLPSGDYSRQLAEDKAGSDYDASAIDMSMSAADMKLVTGRLIRSADDPNDLRLNVCREFYGTVDGVNVVGRDTYYGRFASSDSTHLWHEHVSVLRKHCNDYGAMKAILSVVTGGAGEEQDMTPEQDGILREVQARLRRQDWMWTPTKAQWVAAGGNAAVFDALGGSALIEMLRTIGAKVDVDPAELTQIAGAAREGARTGAVEAADELADLLAVKLPGIPPEQIKAALREVLLDAATP